MSDTLTAAQSAIITRIRRAATVTDRNVTTIADGLVALKASGLSGRAVARHLAGTDYPLGVNRVAVILRTRQAHPDASPAEFAAHLREATAANTGNRTATVTDSDSDTAEPVTAAAPAAVTAAPVTAPVTLDMLTDRLADLFDAARTLPAADLTVFLAAVDAEVSYSAPVTVTVPVAA